MKRQTHFNTRPGIILVASILLTPNIFAQQFSGNRDPQAAAQLQQYQEKLQQVTNDKGSYAAAIVSRWSGSASSSEKWDANTSADLYIALMRLQPENLLAAGEASSYDAMMAVIATGRASRTRASVGGVSSSALSADALTAGLSPNALGDTADDMVYTPVAPCRIVDTRVAGGILLNGTTRSWDMDGTNFSGQGGSSTSCGIPSGVAQAVAMNITVTQPDNNGFLTAWRFGSARPLASVINFYPGLTVANSTIIPTFPGGGSDFDVYAGGANTHVVVDVIGYFAAPIATALDCNLAASSLTAIPVNVWTAVDATCSSGRTATGGGWYSPEGTLGYPGVWLQTIPGAAYGFNGWRVWVDNQTNGSRSIQTWSLCCRVPGR